VDHDHGLLLEEGSTEYRDGSSSICGDLTEVLFNFLLRSTQPRAMARMNATMDAVAMPPMAPAESPDPERSSAKPIPWGPDLLIEKILGKKSSVSNDRTI
jgi:hypothetical protein